MLFEMNIGDALVFTGACMIMFGVFVIAFVSYFGRRRTR